MSIIVSQTGAGTSVYRILTLSLKDIGALGTGETPSNEDIADSFDTLKQLIGQWQADGLMVYARDTVSFSLTGAQSYTIGDGGDVDTTRPTQITEAFWRSNGIDYPLQILTSFEEYQRIDQKSLASMPEVICYDPDYALGTLFVWPAGTTGEIHLTVFGTLPSYAEVTDSLSVPPEYELAIRYSLDELLSAAFQLPLRPDLAGLAKRARKILKRNNARIQPLQQPCSVLPNHRSDINRG